MHKLAKSSYLQERRPVMHMASSTARPSHSLCQLHCGITGPVNHGQPAASAQQQ